jgi:hypothetical protein
VDSPKKPPIVFANNVIRNTVDHTVDESIIVSPQDYTMLRVAFRKLGGSWEQLADGDIRQIRLLSKIVKKWGKMPGRKRESEMV